MRKIPIRALALVLMLVVAPPAAISVPRHGNGDVKAPGCQRPAVHFPGEISGETFQMPE